jgi:hypothetical protein
MKRILPLILFMLPIITLAQSNRWKKMRHEYIGGLGAANVLGDLGGANRDGTHFVRDLEYKLTRMNGMAGFRYRIAKQMYIKTGFYYGRLLGNDNTTKWYARSSRNLSVRTDIWELSSHYEYTFNNERDGHHYNIKHVHGWKGIHILCYGFAGVGIFRFNPKGAYNGSYYALQPLSTEGQGMTGGPAKKYSRIGVCIPFGLGAKYSLGKHWSVGIEYGLRKTFTDYIDDVSTNYYDKTLLRGAKGDAAAYFSDPSGIKVTGEIRGNPKYTDAYMFALVTVGYKYHKGRKTKAKF